MPLFEHQDLIGICSKGKNRKEGKEEGEGRGEERKGKDGG